MLLFFFFVVGWLCELWSHIFTQSEPKQTKYVIILESFFWTFGDFLHLQLFPFREVSKIWPKKFDFPTWPLVLLQWTWTVNHKKIYIYKKKEENVAVVDDYKKKVYKIFIIKKSLKISTSCLVFCGRGFLETVRRLPRFRILFWNSVKVNERHNRIRNEETQFESENLSPLKRAGDLRATTTSFNSFQYIKKRHHNFLPALK